MLVCISISDLFYALLLLFLRLLLSHFCINLLIIYIQIYVLVISLLLNKQFTIYIIIKHKLIYELHFLLMKNIFNHLLVAVISVDFDLNKH